MRRWPIAVALSMLAACSASQGNATGNQAVDRPAAAAAGTQAAPRPARGPFAVDEEGDGLSFAYGWPPEADEIPALRARLHAEMERDLSRARRYARDDRREAAADGREFHAHYFSRRWTVAGNNALLLSLSAQQETYDGGAHGNMDYAALLWDRSAAAPVRTADLLGRSLLSSLQPRFCAALGAERARRRGVPAEDEPSAIDAFNACPDLAGLVLVPTDDDGNNRFERVTALLPPYAVGPYAEGDYVIDLPLRSDDLGRIAERVRGVFEAGRPLPEQREQE